MPPQRGSASAEPSDYDRSVSAAPLEEEDLVDGKAKYACEYCKRRKLKCSRDVPICDFCLQHKHECVYSRVVRTPLTRRNLDAAESRIRRLEQLLSKQQAETSADEATELLRTLPPRGPPPLPPPPPAAEPPFVTGSDGTVSTTHPSSFVLPRPDPGPSRLSTDPVGDVSFTDGSASGLHPQTFPPPQLPSHLTQSPTILPSPPRPIGSSSAPISVPDFRRPTAIRGTSAAISTLGPTFGHPTSANPNPAHPSEHPVPPVTHSSVASTGPSEAVHETDEDGMGALTVDAGTTSSSYLGSLSGAGLLHFLQRCATDVDLASKATLKGVTSPSSTFSAGASIPADQLAAYIEAYFTIFHVKYPLVHQATFRAQLGDIVPRTGGAAWTLLHTAILGLGSMCVSGDTGDGSETLCLYDKAVGQVSAAMFDTSSLTAVQAFTLLANLSQKLNHVSQGTVFLGIALRMAINLGLHCEASAKNMSLFEQEQRRRVWYTLFCFESGAAITFGHPSTLPTFGVDVWPVLNAPDTVFTPATTVRPAPSSGATVYSSIFYQACFHQLAGQVLNCLTVNPFLPLDDVLRLYRDVDSFQSSLPPFFFSAAPTWFDFARHTIAWRLDNLRMVVLRQTFLKVSLAPGPVSPEEERCWGKCVECAAEVIRSVQRYTSSGNRCMMELWYALHFVIPSTFLPLIALRVRPSSPSAIEWLEVVQSAKSILERIPHALLKPLATRCLTIITAVANLSEGGRPFPEVEQAPLDADFTNFLEMLAGPTEMDGMPTHALQAPGLLPDLDALFQWFTPSGSPQPH